MAATYTNKVLASSEVDGNSLTVPDVPGSTGNKIVLIVTYRDENAQVFSSAPAYGATPMTQVGSAITGNQFNRTVWELDDPAGTENISFTLSATSSYRMAVAFVLSTAGACGTPQGANTGGDELISATVESEADGICLDFAVCAGGAGLTADAGQSNTGTQGATYLSGASTKPGAASVTMGWTWTGLAAGATVVVPIGPTGGAPPTTDATVYRMLLLGVG